MNRRHHDARLLDELQIDLRAFSADGRDRISTDRRNLPPLSGAGAAATWAIAREEFAALGYGLPAEPPEPGGRRRVASTGKSRTNRSTSVTLAVDGRAVFLVDFATGFRATAFGASDEVGSPARDRCARERIERARRDEEIARRERQVRASHEAWRVWERASPCTDHPRLADKGVRIIGLRCVGPDLLLPLTDLDGVFVSVQIMGRRGKRYWPGAPGDGVFVFDRVDEARTVLVCEGISTGATLFGQTGCPVVCAMSAHRLKPTAVALRTRLPGSDLVICGDDDRGTRGNPGRTQAEAAARAAGGRVSFPRFCPSCDGHCTDFNDTAACRRRSS